MSPQIHIHLHSRASRDQTLEEELGIKNIKDKNKSNFNNSQHNFD